MGTVLLTWELGAGIGHLMNLRPIGEELLRRGHRVVAALRDISRAEEIFSGSGIRFLPAPFHRSRSKTPPFQPEMGLAHILGNVGFSDEVSLAALFSAWNTLFDWIKPDLIVADHSPTALLASRGRPFRRVNVGLGFFCPPDAFPLPHSARRSTVNPAERMAQDEMELVQKVNVVLKRHERPELARLGQLFNQIDEVFLATYREFDHFAERSGAKYWGHWPFGAGIAPNWPEGKGKKIYAYLKPFPAMEEVLRFLLESGFPTIVFAGGIDRSIQERYSGLAMRFEQQPLDLKRVAAECDLAILNSGHGTTVSILLAGKPCVLVPIFTEQLLFSLRVKQLGAATMAPIDDGARIISAVKEVIDQPQYRQSAEAFAARYSGWTPGQQIPELVDRMERHLRR